MDGLCMKHNIVVAGDFVPREDIAPYDPFSDDIKKLFKSSSYVIINLETPLTKRGKPILKTGMNFRRDPKYAKILKDAGVDCVCLANNHMRDYGDEGVEDTIMYCREAGLDVIGAGLNKAEAAKPLIKKINGQIIGFLNYCEKEFSIASDNRAGSNPYEDILAYYDITKLKKEVEKVVVIYHGGLEYQHMPTLEMVKSFRFMIDVGADAIISHHAHAYSGHEVYKGKPIFYGLGNLLLHTSSKQLLNSWFTGFTVSLCLDATECTNDIYPIEQDEEMLYVDLMSSNTKEKILKHLQEINHVINSRNLEDYWIREYKKLSNRTLGSFLASSRAAYRLQKFLKIRKTAITKYRRNIWLNTLRCVSHREKMIHLLEKITEQ